MSQRLKLFIPSVFVIFIRSFLFYLLRGIILHVPYYGSIIAIDDIIASDNITALALKALLKYNRLSTIEIKNVYVYVYIIFCV